MVGVRAPGALRSDAEPEIPVDMLGRGRWLRTAAVAPGPVGPGVHRAHLADGTTSDDLDAGAVGNVRVDLDTHLGDHPGLLRRQANLAGFVDLVAEGLLAVDVLAMVEGGHRDRRMHMVGHGHVTGVDVLMFLVEELAEIVEARGLRVLLGDRAEMPIIDVAESDDLRVRTAGEHAEVVATHAGDAAGRVTDLGVGRVGPGD